MDSAIKKDGTQLQTLAHSNLFISNLLDYVP